MLGGDLRNCRGCGRPFVSLGQAYCTECLERDEEEFEKVRRYVKEHPGATIEETAEQTQVKKERILEFLRQDRLEFDAEGIPELSCSGCGAPIRSGSYCASCKAQLEQEVNRLISRNEPGKADLLDSLGSRFYTARRFLGKRPQ